MGTSYRIRSVSRRGSAILATAAAVLVGLAPVASAEARGIARACPSDAPDAFADDEESVHHDPINCLAYWEIIVGSDVGYQPGNHVTRAQMASFLANFLKVAAYDFQDDPPDAFDDDDGTVHEANINSLAAAQVLSGTSERQYSPGQSVTRGQMASLLVAAVGAVTGSEPRSDVNAFDDDDGSVHEASIDALASLGVVEGTGDRSYSPGGQVRRDAMASFVARTADYLAAEGHWPPLTEPGTVEPTYAVTPETEQAFAYGQTRTFTVEVEAGTVVDIRLFPSADVSTAGGATRFRDEDDPVGQADEAVSSAQITRVNGASVTPAQQVNDVTSSGSIEFVVQSNQDADVLPVVWADPGPDDGGNNALDLFGTREPLEPFGIGGRTLFVPGEASGGQTTPTARTVSPDLNLIVSTASVTYYYAEDDTFRFKGAGITLAQFEAMLSGGDAHLPNKGDVLEVNYNPTLSSVFNITQDNVKPPVAPQATLVEADGDGRADDVRVSLDYPSYNGGGTTYDLQRRRLGSCDDVGGEVQWSTIQTEIDRISHTDHNPGAGCYEYRLVAHSPVSGSTATSDASGRLVVPE